MWHLGDPPTWSSRHKIYGKILKINSKHDLRLIDGPVLGVFELDHASGYDLGMVAAASKKPVDYGFALVIALIVVVCSFWCDPDTLKWAVFAVGVAMAAVVLALAARPVPADAPGPHEHLGK